MKTLRRIVCVCVLASIGILAAIGTLTVVGLFNTKPDTSSRVLVTAAHLGDIDGYTCIYSDEESDVGVYIVDGYTAVAPPVGSKVIYKNGRVGEIVTVSASEFTMKPQALDDILPGVSGTPIYYREVPIGFISGWDGTGNVRCIFY